MISDRNRFYSGTECYLAEFVVEKLSRMSKGGVVADEVDVPLDEALRKQVSVPFIAVVSSTTAIVVYVYLFLDLSVEPPNLV